MSDKPHSTDTDRAQLYRMALDSLMAQVIVCAIRSPTDIRIAFANQAALQVLGFEETALIDKRVEDLLILDEAMPVIHSMQVCVSTGQMVTDDLRATTPSGVAWYRVTCIPVRHAQGHITHIVATFYDITDRKQHETKEHETLAHQAAALAELSTPLLVISATAVVMPLIGGIDAMRAQQILETLMTGIAAHKATVVIIDITGVAVVDTYVASVLIRASQAVRLLGAQVVLTGIRPEVSQTIVGLGIDLKSIITRATLRDGITYALHQ